MDGCASNARLREPRLVYRRRMSDRGRVLLIFGAVALVAGGAGFYFFKVYQPAQALGDAQVEINGWEARYQEARSCLLGQTPLSTKTSEALAIREMAPDPWDRGKCTPLVSKLSRGVSNDTGVEDVEAAWNELDKAAQAAAIAFAKHTASITTKGEDPLPSALDALDAARTKLRTVAKLPNTQVAGTPLPVAEIIPIADGKEPVSELFMDSVPSAHGFVAFGRTASRQVQVTLAAGAAPKVIRVGSGSIRAVPDLTWGATASRLVARGKGKSQDSTGQVSVGAMNEEGVIATPSLLELTAPMAPQDTGFAPDVIEPGEEVGSIMLAAAGGSLGEGAIVYGATQTLVVARAKANVVTADRPIKIDVGTAAMDLDGRIAVVWTTLDKVHRALLLRKGGEEAFELPASFAGVPCLTNDRVWVVANEPEVFAFGGGKPLERIAVSGYSGLQGCTGDAAIVRTRDRHRDVDICTDRCRKVSVPSGAPEYATVTAIGGKLRAVAAHAGVVGVWSEDKPPVFYSLPVKAMPLYAHDDPAMALTDGKVIDVIARGDDKLVLIRLRAP